MKNILIPTDFSENARNAIRYALDYFADIPVNFYILNVSRENKIYKEEDEVFFESSAQTHIIEKSAALLVEEIKICQSFAKNSFHNFYSLQENMQLVEAIRKHVAEKEVDYILMGTKGASKISRKEIGTNTSDVITKVKCPVLVIPENAKFKKIQNLVFLTDYNFLYRNKVTSRLSETLKLHAAALRILHIRSQDIDLKASQIDNKIFLNDFFKETKNSFHFVENKNIETGVQHFVETWDIDMIALVGKNLNFIDRLLFKPMVRIKNHQIEVPFLVLHE